MEDNKAPKTDRLTEIRDILKRMDERFEQDHKAKQSDQPKEKGKGKEKPKAKESKEKAPSLWASVKDFGSSIKSLFSARDLGDLASHTKGVFNATQNATQAVRNLVAPSTSGTSGAAKSAGKTAAKTASVSKATQGAGRGAATAAQGAARAAGAAGNAGGAAGGATAGGAASGAAGGVGRLVAGAGRALASAGPIPAIIAIVVAVAAAMAALPFLIKQWGESLLESQRKLAESSGGMAQVFARKDVADTMREMRVGDATAKSAGGLSDALIRLEDRIEPFTIIVTDFLNNVMTGFVEFATMILDVITDQINGVIVGINKMIPGPDVLHTIEKNTRKKDENTDMGNLIKEWANAGKAYHSGPAHGASGRPVRGLGTPLV